MSDLTTSIKEIFNERISSPFYGSLIVSWLLWNWEIPYITLFVDGDKLDVNKIDYIRNNFNNILYLIILPLISTGLIIWVLPLITNLAYKITLEYDSKRIKQKNEIEGKRQLTLEESMQLRLDLQNLQETYALIINNKEKEISSLKGQLESAMNTIHPKEVKKTEQNSFDQEFQTFSKAQYFNTIQDIGESLRAGNRSLKYLKPEVIDYYLAYNILESRNGNYFFTSKGESFYSKYLKMIVDKKIPIGEKHL